MSVLGPIRGMLSPVVPGLGTPPLALRNVTQGGARTLAAIAGVGFVVTMVLLQLGFLQAVRDTATGLYTHLDFDAVLISPRYEQLYEPGAIPLERLRQAEGLGNVVSASPFYAIFAMWRCPPVPLDREASRPGTGLSPPVTATGGWFGSSTKPTQRRELLAIGIDPGANPFRSPIRDRIEAAAGPFRMQNRVLLDEKSHPDFGWWAWPAFDGWELGRSAVEVVGGFPLERGFGADGAVLCSDTNFLRLCAPPGYRGTSMGLLKLRDAGAVNETIHQLNATLPADTIAISRDELFTRERDYWVNKTSTGKIFASGVLVAMAVAAVVVYQVLSNDVRSHLAEYATLKAMGYTNGYLSRVVVGQSLIYALGAFGPALVLSFIAYRATEALADIPMRFTALNLSIALGLAIVVSLGSALLTVGKVRTADPAELY